MDLARRPALPELPELLLDLRSLDPLLACLGKLSDNVCLVRRLPAGFGKCPLANRPEEPPEHGHHDSEDQQHQAGVERLHPAWKHLQLLPELEQTAECECQKQHHQQGKEQQGNGDGDPYVSAQGSINRQSRLSTNAVDNSVERNLKQAPNADFDLITVRLSKY